MSSRFEDSEQPVAQGELRGMHYLNCKTIGRQLSGVMENNGGGTYKTFGLVGREGPRGWRGWRAGGITGTVKRRYGRRECTRKVIIRRDGDRGGKWVGKDRLDCQTFHVLQFLQGKPGVDCVS